MAMKKIQFGSDIAIDFIDSRNITDSERKELTLFFAKRKAERAKEKMLAETANSTAPQKVTDNRNTSRANRAQSNDKRTAKTNSKRHAPDGKTASGTLRRRVGKLGSASK
jgi:hypothetical protein